LMLGVKAGHSKTGLPNRQKNYATWLFATGSIAVR